MRSSRTGWQQQGLAYQKKKATMNTNTDAILHAVFRHCMRSSRPSLQTKNKTKKQPRIQTRMQHFMLYSGSAWGLRGLDYKNKQANKQTNKQTKTTNIGVTLRLVFTTKLSVALTVWPFTDPEKKAFQGLYLMLRMLADSHLTHLDAVTFTFSGVPDAQQQS